MSPQPNPDERPEPTHKIPHFPGIPSLTASLRETPETPDRETTFKNLITHHYDQLPLPAKGQTLTRWQALSAVAACDLSLTKLFEGHTDALAILAELAGPPSNDTTAWAVWAAEPPTARVTATAIGGKDKHPQLILDGTKAWCSGARIVDAALITAWLDGAPILAAVSMNQPGVSIDSAQWHAVGMQATNSADVHFEGVSATQVGGPHRYVERPGFWHGGAGIAACWYGAAAAIGGWVRDAVQRRAEPHRLAHLGAIDVALASAAAALREAAATIDAHPHADSQRVALRVRLIVEAAATEVMTHAGRALGAAPLCRDARFARAMADLPVFLRQSHAENDLAALGQVIVGTDKREDTPWML